MQNAIVMRLPVAGKSGVLCIFSVLQPSFDFFHLFMRFAREMSRRAIFIIRTGDG